MAPKMFGQLFRELRQNRGFTLREYCRTFKKDPGNISKMERGKIAPPVKDNELKELAKSVGLKENSEEWQDFISKASISAGRIPSEVMSDEEVLQHLPILLRSITGEKLDEEKLRALVEVIRST